MKKKVIETAVLLGCTTLLLAANVHYIDAKETQPTNQKIHYQNTITVTQKKEESFKPIVLLDIIKLRDDSNNESTETVNEKDDYNLTDDEIYLLARIVTAEASGEPMEGKEAVVEVVLNRVDSNAFPDTIEDVIYEKNQFGCIKDGNFDKAANNITSDDYDAVYSVLDERHDTEILYFTAGKYGKYGTPAYKIGHHYFSKK